VQFQGLYALLATLQHGLALQALEAGGSDITPAFGRDCEMSPKSYDFQAPIGENTMNCAIRAPVVVFTNKSSY
jgi:hypothetical protein